MEVKFLGQGFEEESPGAVGHHLLQFLTQRDYHTFTAISAFAGESGIQGLFNKLEEAKSYFQYINLIIGVDMKGTSKEALEAILRLDINSFVFYNKTATIFHPKIYLFEGDEKAEIIIGSSNLTAKGLFQNVEASVLISIIKSDPIDLAFLDSVKAYFAGLFDFSDPNLQRLSNELIEYLVEANIVPLEKERREMQEKTKIVIEGLKDSKIEFFPPRQVPKIPPAFLASIRRSKKEVARPIPQVGARPSATEPLVSRGILVWIKNKLPKSDVQMSSGNTNPTGGLRLVKANFTVNGQRIDQTTYFRDELFGRYNWTEIKQNPYVEMAIVPFEITIKSEFLGRFDLVVRHKPEGEAEQNNYTTLISWGELGDTIRDANLVGARLELYAPVNEHDAFQIVIL